MVNRLPYEAKTSMGEVMDIDFTLHPQTASPMRVTQMLSVILEGLDRDIGIVGETSNGDVLQALAMALAIRSEMIAAPNDVTNLMSVSLLQQALQDTNRCERRSPQSGNA